MGLLDWLTSDLSMGGGPSPGAIGSMGMDSTAMPQPLPPQATPPAAPPSMPPQGGLPPNPQMPSGAPLQGSMPDGSPMDVPPAMPPMPPPISVPPRGAPDASMMPPSAPPPINGGMQPSAPMSLAPPTGETAPNPNAPTTFLGRALGLDANKERSLRGSLGAGLKSVGTNWNKPGLAAFAGSVGSSIEGGQQAEDKGYDQRLKGLTLAVNAQAAGDKAAYNQHYATYLGAKLKADGERVDSKAAGKSGAWNKPDSQKFIDAQNALSKDPDIRASQKILEAALKAGDPKEVAAAQAAHAQLTEKKGGLYLQGVGLDPKKMMDLQKNPPGTPANPHSVTSKSDFDIYVKPGQAYINPADGKTYIRKGGDAAGGVAPSAGAAMPKPAASPPLPPGPPPMPMSPTATTATSDDEE